MTDLLGDARQLRQRLYRLEVLLEIEKGGRRSSGKASDDPERAAAIRRLVKSGLVETGPTAGRYRLTSDGFEFLKEIRAKVGSGGALDWTHADEIDFSRL